ncbi:DUF1835 domain-containing protein [Flagellimonas allohymeniacidonis]|uniref:DUF1835 domain-containing protein n=1 Tax=Flagellimonas allohymeniacidonis TaxID=2517819 RepID=A0A4Q8QHV1_9FLAO|nr:DUF1835 domain-containing protein [Allomuricauda hymeniacidonis]TAI48868.1 DUF1835 domain-containing protein [Allomuricauda hymeniacidonis]
MKSLLHITNGDSFTTRLKSLDVKGDIITWREMLCEGKTLCNVGSESFWKTRFEFLNRNYKVSKSWFVEKTLKEYRSLCNHKQQDQIVLWFEYDLFCQINMLAVLSWLKTHRRHAEISLVCSGKEDESDKLYALNELSDEKLLSLYKNRIKLTQDDIEFADYVWQLYCSDNPMRLENIITHNAFQFQYLSDALRVHLKRFPTIKNGLNELENRILLTVEEQKPESKKELLGELLSDQGYYGFGDTQYERIITSLRPLLGSVNPLKLTKKGKQVLANQMNYYSQIRDNQQYLGGSLKYNFLYNSTTDRILKL